MAKGQIIKSVTPYNKILAELYHYLVNTVSSITSVQQLAELEKSYTDKFLETTKEKSTSMAKMLEAMSTLRGLVDNKIRLFLDGEIEVFEIEDEVTDFLKSMKKKQSPEDSK